MSILLPGLLLRLLPVLALVHPAIESASTAVIKTVKSFIAVFIFLSPSNLLSALYTDLKPVLLQTGCKQPDRHSVPDAKNGIVDLYIIKGAGP